MKSNTTFAELLIIVLSLAPLAYAGLIWDQLPAEMATHYDLEGNANGWMRKDTTLLFISGLTVLLYLLLRFLPKIDAKGQLQTANFLKLRVGFACFFSAIMGLLFYMAAHPSDTGNGQTGLLVLTALLIAVMGNYITTVKPNFFVGIRTPWTLQSDVVWQKTHRMGGRLMVAGGVLGAILALAVPAPYTVGSVVGVILLATLIPVVYSYIYFREEKSRQLN